MTTVIYRDYASDVRKLKKTRETSMSEYKRFSRFGNGKTCPRNRLGNDESRSFDFVISFFN